MRKINISSGEDAFFNHQSQFVNQHDSTHNQQVQAPNMGAARQPVSNNKPAPTYPTTYARGAFIQ